MTQAPRLLCLTRYPRVGASSRMRFFQFIPGLRAAGFEIEMVPLFTDSYVKGLQQGRKDIVSAGAGLLARALVLLRSAHYQALWIEKEPLPWVPYWLEKGLHRKRIPYVLDYDDAVFHHYDGHSSPLIRRLLGHKHDRLMANAALVVAGNAYLAQRARCAGAPRVEILPTVVDLARFPRTPRPDPSGTRGNLAPVVGWIGQQSTARYLAPLGPVLGQLVREGSVRLAAIGIDGAGLGLPMDSTPWREASEARDLARFDIGIMPLRDGPLERGKCGYKLIQYMACGLPVVASPVGVNRQIVEHGVNGFLAETAEEWLWALRTLAADPDLRNCMGSAGRKRVEAHYSLQVTGPRLVALLKAVVTGA